jgi:hypothetical protein
MGVSKSNYISDSSNRKSDGSNTNSSAEKQPSGDDEKSSVSALPIFEDDLMDKSEFITVSYSLQLSTDCCLRSLI